ncbi:MAG: metallophosphoesterase [Pseudomonadota bacterium]|nr:metallophosphoesterase [Pseudomonadota bacterium]
MNIQLRRFERNPHGRDFAVGDIHGHFSDLAAGLQAIGFDDACDRLFSLGDLVDRGPESAQVLDWLAKPWFHAVRGNHEAMACAAIGGGEYSVRFHLANGGGWLLALTANERERIGLALLDLPLAMEVDTPKGPVGLVHADLPTDDWQDVRNGHFTPREQDYCIWSVDRYQRQYTAKVRNVRAVVHGHMTIARMQVLGNAHFIDTNGGGGEHGHFTFLELSTLKAHRGPGGELLVTPRKYR